MESNGVTIQNEGTKVCILVEEGTEGIQRNTYTGNKDVVPHIPLSVRKIAEASVNPRRTNEVEVFYAGTKKTGRTSRKGITRAGVKKITIASAWASRGPSSRIGPCTTARSPSIASMATSSPKTVPIAIDLLFLWRSGMPSKRCFLFLRASSPIFV